MGADGEPVQPQPPSPFTWLVDRYCEEFGCGIPQAVDDLENAPLLLVRGVMDLRAFKRTKEALDRATPGSKIEAPTGPMADRVWAAIAAIAAEQNEARMERLREAGDGN